MIAVTGAAGFIGSVLVKALNDRGYDDLLLVDTLGSAGKFKNLRAKKFNDIIAPAQFNLRLITRGSLEVDAILHIGAITDTSEPDADLVLKDNTRYTRRLAEFAIKNGVRFICASSASVYGDGALGFSDDDALTPQLLPLNPYAYSKWLFDRETIQKDWTSKIVNLRFFNVFGPNEYHKGRMASVIWHAYRQINESGRVQLFQSHKEGYAHGEQRRDFVYVDDVVKVVLWFLANPNANGIYNLGSGKARTFNDLAGAIFSAVGKPAAIDYTPTPENIRDSYQYFTEADMTKLRGVGCDHVFRPLEETVADYVKNYLLAGNPYA